VKEAVTKAFGARLLFPEIRLHSPSTSSSTPRSSPPSLLPSPSLLGAADPRPSLEFSGECERLMAARGVSASQCLVSISHDGDYAAAFVLLQSRADAGIAEKGAAEQSSRA
jgi:phosphopantetheinyl transferase (holo-ACP synthase)